MDTEKLIGDLANDLKPVRILPSAMRRTAVFSFSALFLVTAVVAVLGGRSDLSSAFATPRFIFDNVLMFVSGVLAAFAAFHLAVPDTKIRKPVLMTMLLATAGWLALGLSSGVGIDELLSPENKGFSCMRDLASLVVIPVVAGFFMLSRGAPVWQGWAGFGMLLSASSFCGICVRMLCPSDSAAHLLLWHYLPIMGLSFLGIILGKLLLCVKTPAIMKS